MSFDPDAYLARKGALGAFSPDAYLARKTAADPTPGGAAGAAALGLGQGATLGFGDELAGGAGALLDKALPESWGSQALDAHLPTGVRADKELLELYRENRDLARKANATAQREHGGAYLGGQIAGGIATTALLPGMGGASAAKGAMQIGGALGAAQGLGESNADLTQGDVGGAALDTLKGGAMGVGAGLVGHGIGTAIENNAAPLAGKLREFATNQGRRFLSGTSSSLSTKSAISDAAVHAAEDLGAIGPLKSISGAADILAEARQTLGQHYADIVKKLEAAGVHGPNAQSLAGDLMAEARTIRGRTLGSPRPGVYSGVADELAPGIADARAQLLKQIQAQGVVGPQAEQLADQAMQGWKPTGGKPVDAAGNLGLTQAEDMKRELQHLASGEYDKMKGMQTPRGEAQEAVASRVRQAVEDAVQQQRTVAPDLADAFVPVKKQLGQVIEASNAADRGANRALKNNVVSLRDVAAGAGNPLKMAMSYLARTRGSSTAAWGARAASSKLLGIAQTTPGRLGEYGAVLAGALQRGGQDALNAHAYVLGQTDPKFQALQQKLSEEDDQK